ncbi:hypothetical protein Mp_8g17520 [Marchantia polymorpha subsp. ruderalis]|nr:hypothetical protein Mp_8g17520 [Marchantia polymorpha subsp. ruderalis]
MAQKAASRDHQRERERAIRSASSGLGASGSELGAPSAGRMSLAMAEKADPLPLRLRNELVGSGYGGQEGAGLTERESARESESESECERCWLHEEATALLCAGQRWKPMDGVLILSPEKVSRGTLAPKSIPSSIGGRVLRFARSRNSVSPPNPSPPVRCRIMARLFISNHAFWCSWPNHNPVLRDDVTRSGKEWGILRDCTWPWFRPSGDEICGNQRSIRSPSHRPGVVAQCARRGLIGQRA